MELLLAVASHVESTQVSPDALMVQVDASALGRVVDTKALTELPLVNRNFTQITSLSPGVFANVYNALASSSWRYGLPSDHRYPGFGGNFLNALETI